MMQEYAQEVTGTSDALLIQVPGAQQELQDRDSVVMQAGNAVYDYRELGTINGIVVAPEDRDLPIDRDDLLDAAFDLVRTPHAAVFELGVDGAGLEKYTDVMNRVYAGTAIRIDEERQFDAASKAFIIWLRYDDVEYRLNPRYKYLKDEIK